MVDGKSLLELVNNYEGRDENYRSPLRRQIIYKLENE